MEVRHGYKQTNVGIIPKDWNVMSLGSCLEAPPRYGINAASVPYSDRLPIYIRITDIAEDGRFLSNKRVSVDSPMSNDYFLGDGDIVFARTGATVGKSYRYNANDGPLVYAGFLICVKPDKRKLLSAFVAAYVTTNTYWRWVRLMSMRSGQPGINSNQYAQLPVPVPSLSEQRVIVEALSDVDGLLGALGALIAKKQAIKQATMQQLFTGKTRLPGFRGEWKTKRLHEIGSFSKGRGIKREDILQDGHPCIRYGELYTQYDNYINVSVSYIPTTIASNTLPIKTNDILFAGSGETVDEIGRCAAYLGNTQAFAGSDIIVFTPFEQNSIFLSHLINHPLIAKQKSRLGQGDAVVHISAKNLGQLEICLPCHDEQTAIATVLSDMDAEVTALERRRDKTRTIKQGMMQQLLTGKIRLVRTEAAS